MDTIETLVLILHVLAALAITGLVLIQRGKGADMGAGFGSGASGTVFGSSGAGSFLTRMTTGLAIAFFLTSFGLAFFAKERSAVARDLGIPQIEDVDQGDSSPAFLDDEPAGEVPAFLGDQADQADQVPGLGDPADASAGEVPALDFSPEAAFEEVPALDIPQGEAPESE